MFHVNIILQATVTPLFSFYNKPSLLQYRNKKPPSSLVVLKHPVGLQGLLVVTPVLGLDIQSGGRGTIGGRGGRDR